MLEYRHSSRRRMRRASTPCVACVKGRAVCLAHLAHPPPPRWPLGCRLSVSGRTCRPRGPTSTSRAAGRWRRGRGETSDPRDPSREMRLASSSPKVDTLPRRTEAGRDLSVPGAGGACRISAISPPHLRHISAMSPCQVREELAPLLHEARVGGRLGGAGEALVEAGAARQKGGSTAAGADHRCTVGVSRCAARRKEASCMWRSSR